MKRIVVVMVALFVGLMSATVVYADPPIRAEAELNSIGGSGIDADITFLDNGHNLVVSGRATGLDPNKRYVSLIYDIGSDPTTCVPSIFDPTDPNFIIPTMCLGEWNVRPNGTGNLSARNTNGGADYVPIDLIGTVSVREYNGENPPCGGAADHAVLVACGSVEIDN